MLIKKQNWHHQMMNLFFVLLLHLLLNIVLVIKNPLKKNVNKVPIKISIQHR